jgi:PAS domain S-box-containing protein
MVESYIMATGERLRPDADDLGSRLEFETLLADTSATLFAVPPGQIEHAIERSLARLRAFFRADRCALLSVSPDQQVVKVRLASYAEGVEPVSSDINLARMFPWSAKTLLVERAPVRVSTIADLPPEADIERDRWIQMPIRSALTLPIETDGSVGHLMLLNTVYREREWPDALVTRLRVFAEMIVGALARNDAMTDLREAEERLESGAELAGLGYYEVDLDRRAMFIDDRLREICGVPAGRQQGLQALEFWLEHLHPEDRPRVLHLREEMHAGRLDRISLEYRYLHPMHGERWINHLAGAATRDAAGRAVRTYGVLRDITERKRSEDELRALSQRLIRAHEDERALLARELHDDLTQRLALLAINVGRAELTAPAGAQAETMRTVREELARLSEDIHSLAYQLHPSVLTELGLVEALRTECERIGRRTSLRLTTQLDSPVPVIAKDAALCLFRVAQEALNNVVRHSRAQAASVVLQPRDGGLSLVVRDDGVGFDLENSQGRMHLGLASMRERVRAVNGTLDIESVPGQGTTLVARVPLEGGPR